MAIAFSASHLNANSRRRFWSIRQFVPAIAVSAMIVSASLAVYDRFLPVTVKAGPVNALSIEHQTWGRTGVAQDIEVRVERSKGRSVKLHLNEAFNQNFAIERTLPLPKTVSTDGDGQTLLFDSPADSNLTVTLTLRPLTWGRSDVQIRSDVAGVMMASSTLSELILP